MPSSQIDLPSGLLRPSPASLSSVTRASTLPRSLGQVNTWQELVDHCDNSGEAGKRDDDEGHLLAEQGEESLLQRGLPQVEPLSLRMATYSKLMVRCVARNPKEMVRQVAAARELDFIEVMKNMREFPPVAPLPRKEANFLPIGILARRPCPSTSRPRRSSSASRTTSRARGGPLLWASPR